MAFIEAIWEKHGPQIATGGPREKHIRDTYLNKNPLRLGGQAVGLPGQSGSNNYGEKKNDTIKGLFRFVTKNIRVEERTKPLFIIAACALELRLENDLESIFAVKPAHEFNDYNI